MSKPVHGLAHVHPKSISQQYGAALVSQFYLISISHSVGLSPILSAFGIKLRLIS